MPSGQRRPTKLEEKVEELEKRIKELEEHKERHEEAARVLVQQLELMRR